MSLFLLSQVPFDTMRLVFPPVPAGIIVLILYLPIAHLLPLNVGRALLAGGLLGHNGYDLTHYYLHHGSPTPGSYFASLKTYHVAHHYINYNQGLCICVLAHNIRDTLCMPSPPPPPLAIRHFPYLVKLYNVGWHQQADVKKKSRLRACSYFLVAVWLIWWHFPP